MGDVLPVLRPQAVSVHACNAETGNDHTANEVSSTFFLLYTTLRVLGYDIDILDGQLAPQITRSSSVVLYSCAFAVEGIVGGTGKIGRIAGGEALLCLEAEAADGGSKGATGSAEAEHCCDCVEVFWLVWVLHQKRMWLT